MTREFSIEGSVSGGAASSCAANNGYKVLTYFGHVREYFFLGFVMENGRCEPVSIRVRLELVFPSERLPIQN
jgi:hypothetical protein